HAVVTFVQPLGTLRQPRDEGIVRLRPSSVRGALRVRAGAAPGVCAHISLATRLSVPRRANPTAPNRPLRQRSIGQSGPFARSIERGHLRAHACCLAVLARGELAAAKFDLARDGVPGAGYSASAGTRASDHRGATTRIALSAVAVGQRNGLVEKPQTRAGRLKTEVV